MQRKLSINTKLMIHQHNKLIERNSGQPEAPLRKAEPIEDKCQTEVHQPVQGSAKGGAAMHAKGGAAMHHGHSPRGSAKLDEDLHGM